ncbi:anthranilate phosphoribosyltransferase [Desulfobacter hydrogenophilus]|uniref:Anthranilate phosphoribosyltransferase n=1 Tax=Desulfobacter hydrogenophilus TaxID=2291 RepID=A0A328FD35_9BACT|nr:anthranilate phosphoribosyltransferase [Desulfobacter hydrogenophilus]NDY72110.1 anthranilate phosphoribosyltransferase [Desulfobacter hydrogenophilus]QBH14835.1 anthranilate phosphoribosyltransferase [Desulfobacter hydrogenophilus]RAM01342.1 anthranilate phosphoribosyltransferase [Desulfobacter hydrogenophilus]
MDFTDYLNTIVNRQNLSQDQMADMLNTIFSGQATEAQVGAFMAALATKGETFEELAGAARAMRTKAVRVQTLAKKVIDTCGTGGDASGSFNISTTTAFVIAGAGVTVAKHGNRSVTSKCGSADVLEELGINLSVDPEIVEEAINEIGIGFMFAPLYHGSMKYAMKARTECKIRSIFNMLGPLTNPAAASCQILGVYAPELTEMFGKALNLLGVEKAFVVHGHDGMDEMTTTDLTRVTELNDGMIKTYDVDPLTYFDEYADPKDLLGGDAKHNAAITRAILSGGSGPKQDIVLLNAGAGLVAADAAPNIEKGIEMALKSIETGAAMEKLELLADYTRENA